MSHLRRVLVTLIFLALVLVVPAAGHAQESITIEELTVRIWPEFDQPTALVFYIGRVAEDTPLPVELRFQMPAGATLNATAYVDTDSTLIDAPARTTGNTVTITSPNGTFWVEFYDPALRWDDSQRSYSLIWQSEYPVRQLTWEVQLPVGANVLVVDPSGGSFTTDQYGLPVYTITVDGPAAGGQASLSASYTKTTDTLSAQVLGLPVTATAAPASQGNEFPLWAVVVLVVAGLAVVGGVVYYFLQGRKRLQAKENKKERVPSTMPARGKKSAEPPVRPAVTTRFCSQCGQPIVPGDQFCRNCGTKLSE